MLLTQVCGDDSGAPSQVSWLRYPHPGGQNRELMLGSWAGLGMDLVLLLPPVPNPSLVVGTCAHVLSLCLSWAWGQTDSWGLPSVSSNLWVPWLSRKPSSTLCVPTTGLRPNRDLSDGTAARMVTIFSTVIRTVSCFGNQRFWVQEKGRDGSLASERTVSLCSSWRLVSVPGRPLTQKSPFALQT